MTGREMTGREMTGREMQKSSETSNHDSDSGNDRSEAMIALGFRVKICGVRSANDVESVVESRAGAIGFNFYPKSRRFLALEKGAELAKICPPRICRVGVFVNAKAEAILRTRDSLLLDVAQLHGDEPPELGTQLEGVPFVRAFRFGPAGFSPVAAYLAKCDELGIRPAGVLIDASVPGQYGGTGTTVDWTQLVDHQQATGGVPLILAGGLTPKNVADAIKIVRPAAVDTAGGVESGSQGKDPKLVNQFYDAADRAFNSLSNTDN